MNMLKLIGVFIGLLMAINSCATQSTISNKILKKSDIQSANKEWSKGFMIIPLKIDRSSNKYQEIKPKVLNLLQGEANRDRLDREDLAHNDVNRARYCQNIAKNVGKRNKTISEFKEAMHVCMQAQYRSDMASLKTTFGKSLLIYKDDMSHYAHFRWHLFTRCGNTQKQTRRNIYYGFIEPTNKPKEAYFFLSYSTQNECEAVYEKLRRKCRRVLRKTKKLLNKSDIKYSQTNDTF